MVLIQFSVLKVQNNFTKTKELEQLLKVISNHAFTQLNVFIKHSIILRRKKKTYIINCMSLNVCLSKK